MKTKWRDKGEKRGEGRNKNKFEQRKRRESCSHRAREITNEIETRRCGKRIKIKRGCIPGAKSPLGLRNGKPGLDLSTPRHISSNPKIREGRRNNNRLFSVFSRFPNPLSREKGGRDLAHFRYLPSPPLYPIHVHISLINLFEHPRGRVCYSNRGKKGVRLYGSDCINSQEEEELRLRARGCSRSEASFFFLEEEANA